MVAPRGRDRLVAGLLPKLRLKDKQMHRAIVVTLTLGLATLIEAPSVAQEPGHDLRVSHMLLDSILRENVRDEGVDYLNIRRHHLGALRDYLSLLGGVRIERLHKDEQLAFYINLYNATVIHAVIERFTMGYSVAKDDFAVFTEPLAGLEDRKISLNDLENKIIRPQFTEPRIHVALVCGARSCPPILPRAYRAGDLDDVLKENMRRFINDPKRNRIDANRGKVTLSRIFDWYADDFGGKNGLTKYIDGYTKANVAGAKVDFLDYSWELNIVAPRGGTWVTVKTAKATLHSEPGGGQVVGSVVRGDVLGVLEQDSRWLRIWRPMGDGDAWLEGKLVEPFHVDGG